MGNCLERDAEDANETIIKTHTLYICRRETTNKIIAKIILMHKRRTPETNQWTGQNIKLFFCQNKLYEILFMIF